MRYKNEKQLKDALAEAARENEKCRIGFERIAEIADELERHALARMAAARRMMNDATNDEERQAAEGLYLEAVDDRHKCAVLYAAAKGRASRLARS